ncbi:hypothetical protein CALCODRAFT_512920 [Calocera cornea HHB12733]|uniref:Uncharacterized protein n=1 Tax=Calocera cornea HHB12733 TaxID=1353952 RepID=A0A165CMX9_9BASI|nr:hypothetical protein CALCODRAFT_512920 [Calocera cornea HHB12733]
MAPVLSPAHASSSSPNVPQPKVYRPPHRSSLPPPTPASATTPTASTSTPTPTTANPSNPPSQRPLSTTRPQAPKLQMPHFPGRKRASVLTAYGDSFVGPLELLGDKAVVKKYSGASAKGLNNPKSVSQTGQELLFHLDRFRPPNVLLIFGHVDLQVVYLYKVSESERLGTPAPDADAWVRTVYEAYEAYLKEKILPHVVLRAPATKEEGADEEPAPDPDRFISRLYISSVTAPTVPDDFLDQCSEKYNESAAAAWQEKGIKLASARSATDFTTRRRMVYDFNAMVQRFCEQASEAVTFVDLNPRITDPKTGVVLPPYLVPDKSTIHVVWETTIGFWVDALRSSGLSESDIPPDLEESLKNYEEDKRGRMERRSPTPRKHMRYGSASVVTPSSAAPGGPPTPTLPSAGVSTATGARDSPRSPFAEPRSSPFGERNFGLGEGKSGGAFAHMQPRERPGAGSGPGQGEKRAVYRPPHSRASGSTSGAGAFSPTSAVSPASALSPTPSSALSPISAASPGPSLAPTTGMRNGKALLSPPLTKGTNVVPQDDPRRMGSFVHGHGLHRKSTGPAGAAAVGALDGPMGSIGSRPAGGKAAERKDGKGEESGGGGWTVAGAEKEGKGRKAEGRVANGERTPIGRGEDSSKAAWR